MPCKSRCESGLAMKGEDRVEAKRRTDMVADY